MCKHSTAVGRILALAIASFVVTIAKPALYEAKQFIAKPNIDSHVMLTVAPLAAKDIEPDKPPSPTPWTIESSPNGGTDYVNQALAHYQSMRLTRQGAAMLIGNFLQEKPSAFITGDPCGGTLGDGGQAHGLGQWHPGRRYDMPCGFVEQLTWAVDVEMVRDNSNGGGHDLSALLRDPSATIDQLDYAIKRWERYGHKGARYEYGLAILSQVTL